MTVLLVQGEIERIENQIKVLEGRYTRLKEELLRNAFGMTCTSLRRVQQGMKDLEMVARRKRELERRLHRLRGQPHRMIL